MKQRVAVFALAAIAAYTMFGLARADDAGSNSDPAATIVPASEAVVFPARDDAWLKGGTFPNVVNLRQIMPGLSKNQVYALLQEPHFSEGFFGVRKWNYIFNFRTGKGNEYITCQYQIVYDKHGFVQSTHWKEHECDALVKPPVVPVAPGPTVTEHFTLDEDVLFAFDRSAIGDVLPEGRTALNEISARLKSEYVKIDLVRIVDHTGGIGTDEYNRGVSLSRAETVRDYLLGRGLPSNPITATGVGSANPVPSICPEGRTAQAIRCMQPDRRVTIDVVGQKHQ
jgi:outer membrane protein OmpA-like peptidoglycan-associated protein